MRSLPTLAWTLGVLLTEIPGENLFRVGADAPGNGLHQVFGYHAEIDHIGNRHGAFALLFGDLFLRNSSPFKRAWMRLGVY
jgi:hypothetical protein